MNSYEVYFHGWLWAEIKCADDDVARDMVIRLFPVGATILHKTTV